MRKAIDHVAQSAADNQSKADGGYSGSGSQEPPREQAGRRQSHRKQHDLGRRRIASEQAERNAAVPSQGQIKEWRERRRIDLCGMRQDGDLRDLVDKDNTERDE